MFSTRTLTQLIRFYGNAYQAAFADYLQKSLEIFTTQQQEFQDRLQRTVTGNPLTAMNEMTQRNLDLWRQVQENFFKAAGLKSGRTEGDREKD
jgi:polyhydroxyalkanoate synthesis regulator protein